MIVLYIAERYTRWNMCRDHVKTGWSCRFLGGHRVAKSGISATEVGKKFLASAAGPAGVGC